MISRVLAASLTVAAIAPAHWHGSEHRAEVVDRSGCLAARSFDSYGWPVKPFDRQHPVRGNFGDPRTIFFGDMTGGEDAAGYFRFHDGVDISAPDGTAVYPVVDGTVIKVAEDHVIVASDEKRHFQYWHIKPDVVEGEPVETDVTVLGHIMPHLGHVHLTEVDDWRVANPLAPGHLFPYRDDVPPWVDEISFSKADGSILDGPNLEGDVEVTAQIHDPPSIPPPGRWRDAPLAPAVVSWWLSADGVPITTPETIFDVRTTLPLEKDFWRIYAPGTRQNFAVSAERHLPSLGQYIFHITHLDTRDFPDGHYTLTVEAKDICGNAGDLTLAVDIDNH
jgi:hypothetical protein